MNAPRRTPAESARAFLTPRRSPQPDPPFLPGAQMLTAQGPCGRVVAYRLGEGPSVVLLHRWEGSPREFAAFVPALLAQGLSIVALDLPAHGASAGEWVSIPLAAQALCALQASLGPDHCFHAAIGHSLGAAILVHALTLGCRVGRVALLAAPARAEDYARDYALRDGLDDAGTEAMFEHMRMSYGVDLHTISIPEQARAAASSLAGAFR